MFSAEMEPGVGPFFSSILRKRFIMEVNKQHACYDFALPPQPPDLNEPLGISLLRALAF